MGLSILARSPNPVSVGDVLMKILETIWRFLVSVVAIAAAGAAVIYIQYLREEPYVPLERKIETAASYEPGVRCAPDHPIYVRFKNKSNEEIGRIDFSIEAREFGRSTNLAAYNESYLDYVLGSDGVADACFKLPSVSSSVALQNLRWSASISEAARYRGPAMIPPPIVVTRPSNASGTK